jgi:hypothetical protein
MVEASGGHQRKAKKSEKGYKVFAEPIFSRITEKVDIYQNVTQCVDAVSARSVEYSKPLHWN